MFLKSSFLYVLEPDSINHILFLRFFVVQGHILYVHFRYKYVQPQIRKSWDSMEKTNKKRK